MAGGGGQKKKSWFLLRPTGSLALSEGVPARGRHFGSLISVRVSEAMKCGGKPKPWGRAQMVERSQELQTEFHFKRGQMAFSSPLKVTWCTKDRHCVDWQMLEDRVNAILHKSMRPKQKDNKAEITCESKSSRTCLCVFPETGKIVATKWWMLNCQF